MTTRTIARSGTIARARRAAITPESTPVRDPTAPGIVRDIEMVRIEVGPSMMMVAANVPGEAKSRVGQLTLRPAVIGTTLSRTLEGRS
jgi:hypothetical protein